MSEDAISGWELHQAVKRERERCAKIAEGEKVDAERINYTDDVAYNLACDHIAAAIRSGK